jgi:hypothetical protein
MASQVSATRLLAEMKVIGKQIDKAARMPFIGVQKGTDDERAEVIKFAGRKVAEVSKEFKANYDALQSLIARRRKIKSALVISNAVTLVTINGEEMTVAEAIELKSTIELHKQVLANMINQSQIVYSVVETGNQEVNRRIDDQVRASLGKEKSKASESEYKEIAGPIERTHLHKLIDPNRLAEESKKLMTTIDQFVLEVDFALSESNSRTTIDIDLPYERLVLASPTDPV